MKIYSHYFKVTISVPNDHKCPHFALQISIWYQNVYLDLNTYGTHKQKQMASLCLYGKIENKNFKKKTTCCDWCIKN